MLSQGIYTLKVRLPSLACECTLCSASARLARECCKCSSCPVSDAYTFAVHTAVHTDIPLSWMIVVRTAHIGHAWLCLQTSQLPDSEGAKHTLMSCSLSAMQSTGHPCVDDLFSCGPAPNASCCQWNMPSMPMRCLKSLRNLVQVDPKRPHKQTLECVKLQ